jgi:DNA-directed RNA polymerase subunit RPC12/RpoP
MTFTYERDENGQYICPHCGVKKRLPSTMNMHRRKCEGDLPYECPDANCDYKCLSKQRLELHVAAKHPTLKVAHAVPLLKCPVKGCTFQTLANGNRLIHFMRKHCFAESLTIMNESETGFDCARCKRTFQSNTAFQYHATHCITLTDLTKAGLLRSILA